MAVVKIEQRAQAAVERAKDDHDSTADDIEPLSDAEAAAMLEAAAPGFCHECGNPLTAHIDGKPCRV